MSDAHFHVLSQSTVRCSHCESEMTPGPQAENYLRLGSVIVCAGCLGLNTVASIAPTITVRKTTDADTAGIPERHRKQLEAALRAARAWQDRHARRH